MDKAHQAADSTRGTGGTGLAAATATVRSTAPRTDGTRVHGSRQFGRAVPRLRAWRPLPRHRAPA